MVERPTALVDRNKPGGWAAARRGSGGGSPLPRSPHRLVSNVCSLKNPKLSSEFYPAIFHEKQPILSHRSSSARSLISSSHESSHKSSHEDSWHSRRTRFIHWRNCNAPARRVIPRGRRPAGRWPLHAGVGAAGCGQPLPSCAGAAVSGRGLPPYASGGRAGGGAGAQGEPPTSSRDGAAGGAAAGRWRGRKIPGPCGAAASGTGSGGATGCGMAARGRSHCPAGKARLAALQPPSCDHRPGAL